MAIQPNRAVFSKVSTYRRTLTTPSFNNLIGTNDRDLMAATQHVSAELTRAGVRHALVGGLALGVWGFPRGTGDADFLIGRESLTVDAAGEARPIPVVHAITESADAPVDAFAMLAPVPAVKPSFLDALNHALDTPFITEGVRVVPPEVLIGLKLSRASRVDLGDVVRVLAAGLIDVAAVRAFLVEHTQPETVALYDQLAREAEDEARRS